MIGQAEIDDLRKACSEIRSRIRAGEFVRVEDLLGSYARLDGNDDAVLELIHAEISVRQEVGQRPSLEEWKTRFPRLITHPDQLPSLAYSLVSELQTLSDGFMPSGRVPSQADQPVAPPQAPQQEASQPIRMGGYQLIEEIGRGGMGVVYKARQTNLSRIVAVKMILAGEHAGLRERARLRLEAEAAAQLIHPNVVQIIEIGEHNGLPFLAMEYVEGGNLARMLRGMPQAFRWTARLAETLARAIDLAHRRGIVHRDLNPSNILMADDGIPKISDFGLAKYLVSDAGISQNGVLLGTPAYMAPEQVSGDGRKVGPATDVYALGVLLYEMIVGTPPFRGLSPMETLCQVMESEVVPPSRLRHGLPKDLETICLKCLERDPGQRYASAEALADDLRRFQDREPILARPTPPIRRAIQWGRRQPLVAALLLTSFLLLASLLALLFLYSAHLNEQSQKRIEILLAEMRDKERAQRDRKVELEKEKITARQWYAPQLNLINQNLRKGEIRVAQVLFEKLRRDLQKLGVQRGIEWHIMERLIHRDSTLLLANTSPLGCVTSSRDGATLAGGDVEGKFFAWHLSDPYPREITDFGVKVLAVAIASDEVGKARMMAAAVLRENPPLCEVSLWDASNSARGPIGTFKIDFITKVHALAFSHDGSRLFLHGSSQTNPQGEVQILRLYGFPGRFQAEVDTRPWPDIKQMVLSPDGRSLALADSRGNVTVRDLDSPGELVRWRSRETLGHVSCLAFQADNRGLAVGWEAGPIWAWDFDSGRIRKLPADARGPARYLGFGPSSRFLIARRGERGLMIHPLNDADSPRMLAEIDDRDSIRSQAISHDGRLLAVASRSKGVRLWDLVSGSPMPVWTSATEDVQDVAFTPDGKALILTLHDSQIRIQALRGRPQPRMALVGHGAEVWTVAFSPDSSLLASGADDHTVKIWEVATGKELASLSGHTMTVTSLAFRPGKSDQLVSVSLDGQVRLWTLAREGDARPRIRGTSVVLHEEKDRWRAVAWSADGTQLAWAGTSGKITLFNLSDSSRKILPDHRKEVRSLAFSPSGVESCLSSASVDATVGIWDRIGEGNGKKEYYHEVDAIAFSRTYLAAGGKSGVVKLWKVNDGSTRGDIADHPGRIRSLAFNPAEDLLATACDDGEVRLWDVKAGAFFYELQGHKARVNAVSFSPDGHCLASGSHDGLVYLWSDREPPSTPSAP